MRHNLNNLGGVTAFAATTLLLLDLHDLAGSTLWGVPVNTGDYSSAGSGLSDLVH